MVARKQGKLGKGGEPDINTIAKKVVFEWQRGQIPYCYLPEGMHESDIEKDEEEEEEKEPEADIIEEEDSEPEEEVVVDMKD
jgi:nuclear GTP-binding protein